MFGIISAIIAGISMSLQGVFNTRLQEKLGVWETNTFVQGSGFLLTIIICLILGKGNFKELFSSNKLYLTGGALGVLIIFTVMNGIGALGATHSIAIILISQLLAASLIDAFGLFGTETIKFTLSKFIGVAVMIIGIVIFKWKS